jgi:hypothetical protein
MSKLSDHKFFFTHRNGTMSIAVEDTCESLDEIVYRIEGFLKACGFEFIQLTIQR